MAIDLANQKGLKNLVAASAEDVPFEDNTFNLVTLMDVLEHLPDESKALNEAYRVLIKEGHLLITVPALDVLWSNHDVINNHFRRYDKKGLVDIVKQAGFKVEKTTFFFSTLFPLYLLRSLLERNGFLNKDNLDYLSLPNSIVNRLIFMILSLEAQVIRYLSLPFGSSLIVLARK